MSELPNVLIDDFSSFQTTETGAYSVVEAINPDERSFGGLEITYGST